MSATCPQISLLIPAYNEAARIPSTLDAYLKAFSERFGTDFEIIVVVNGSTDDTASVVLEFVKRVPQLKMVELKEPVGKGGAIRQGLLVASGFLVGFVDADGSTPPNAYLWLVDRLDEKAHVDMAIANRRDPDSRISIEQPVTRRFLSMEFNWLVRTLFGLRYRDTQCGAKLMRGELAEQMLPLLGATHWVIDVDMLIQCRRLKKSVDEVPTVWDDVPGSTLNVSFKTMYRTFLALMRLRLLYSPFRKVIGVFDKLGGRAIYEEVIRSGSLVAGDEAHKRSI